jgi:O-antigen/teichoic acid export membrane protein
MTVIKKIAYNTVFSAGARIIAVALSLFSLGIIARYLGKEGFGDYSLILSFLYVFNILADLGLYSLMTREISRPGADERKIASNIFTLRIVALFVFLALAISLVWLFPYTERVKLGVVIASFGYLFLSASQVLMGIFQKYLKIDRAGLADIVGRLVQLGLVIIFVYFKLGLFWLLVSLNISCIVNFFLNWIFAKKCVRFGLAFDFSFWKTIIKEALPIAASIVLTLVYFKFDTIFLSIRAINRSSLNPMADVGVYNIAYKILEGLIFFPSMFVGLIMPILSRFAVSDKEQFKRVFQKTFDVLIIFIVPVVIGLLVLSMPIVVLIGGRDFADSASVLKVLSIAVGLIFFGNLFGSSIIALNKQKIGAYIYLSGMIFNIITNLIFIPKYSYFGAAWTTVTTELLVTILMFWLIYRNIKYFPSFNVAMKSFFAGLIMFLFLYFLNGQNLFLLVGGGAIIYFAFLYLIKGITKEEVNLLIKK